MKRNACKFNADTLPDLVYTEGVGSSNLSPPASLRPQGLRLGKPAFAAAAPHSLHSQGEGCHAEARRAQADLLLSIPVLSIQAQDRSPAPYVAIVRSLLSSALRGRRGRREREGSAAERNG